MQWSYTILTHITEDAGNGFKLWLQNIATETTSNVLSEMNSLISSTPLRTLTNPPGSAKEQRKLASKNTNKRVETPVNETEEDDIVCIDTNPEEFRAFIGVQATKDEKSNPNLGLW